MKKLPKPLNSFYTNHVYVHNVPNKHLFFIQKMSSNGSLDYSPEVLCLMYVNGDRDDPNRKTAKIIEEIIRNKLQHNCCIRFSSFKDILRLLLPYEFFSFVNLQKEQNF